MAFLKRMHDWLEQTQGKIDFLGPLAIRIYLAPIFILAGMNKLSNAENVASYFDYLGIPAPELMVYVAGLTEFGGGILLLGGLAVRWITVPLMFMMIVAAGTAHWELQMPWEWRKDLIDDAIEKRSRARSILREHGNYGWLTGAGPITILKNGIEWAATYFLMLLALFFSGSGKLGLDYVIRKRLLRT
jgi:putative oxidoreductase